ncbi:MAG: hypothetical protein M1816_005926 [Peltula sp. TS41687]|nr:MAG: hypothetical protein M1816_005926 [Peltula sp. TS41687]
MGAVDVEFEKLLSSVYRTISGKDVLHGNPHAGNVLYVPSSSSALSKCSDRAFDCVSSARATLIDFGCAEVRSARASEVNALDEEQLLSELDLVKGLEDSQRERAMHQSKPAAA